MRNGRDGLQVGFIESVDYTVYETTIEFSHCFVELLPMKVGLTIIDMCDSKSQYVNSC